MSDDKTRLCLCLHKGKTGCPNPAVPGQLMCTYCIGSGHVAQCPTCKGEGVLPATTPAPTPGHVHNIGMYFGAETIVDESDVDLIEIRQENRAERENDVVHITPEMATKLREILNRRHAEGRE